MLAEQTPASFVGWDLLALGDQDLRGTPQGERRSMIQHALAAAEPPIHLTPATHDASTAKDWFERFEGAGWTVSWPSQWSAVYQPGKRAMLKIKHARTADCAVAGFRWHKNGPGTHIGSLLLGLFDDTGHLHMSASPRRSRGTREQRWRRSLSRCARTMENHPWAEWAEWAGWARRTRAACACGCDEPLEPRQRPVVWEPLRLERVAEVGFDHLQGDRFRHATTFQRWRPTSSPPTVATTSSRRRHPSS